MRRTTTAPAGTRSGPGLTRALHEPRFARPSPRPLSRHLGRTQGRRGRSHPPSAAPAMSYRTHAAVAWLPYPSRGAARRRGGGTRAAEWKPAVDPTDRARAGRRERSRPGHERRTDDGRRRPRRRRQSRRLQPPGGSGPTQSGESGKPATIPEVHVRERSSMGRQTSSRTRGRDGGEVAPQGVTTHVFVDGGSAARQDALLHAIAITRPRSAREVGPLTCPPKSSSKDFINSRATTRRARSSAATATSKGR